MLANWVKQTVSAGGTGNLTLGGAASGFISLDTAFGQGPRFLYMIEDGTSRESGIGYLSASTTLVREKVLETLAAGVYDNTSPTALDISTSAIVMVTATAASMTKYPPMPAMDYDGNKYVGDALQGSAISTQGAGTDRLYLSSFFNPVMGEFTGMGLNVTTLHAGNFMLGLYQTRPDGEPMKLAQIATQLDASTTGFKSASFSGGNLVLQPGFYLTAVHTAASPIFEAVSQSQPGTMFTGPGGAYLASRYSTAYAYSTTLPASLAKANFSLTLNKAMRVFLIKA